MKKFIYEAVRNHFIAERDKYIANIKLQTDNPVGVGEHPKIIEDIISLVHKASEAQDSINMLQDIVKTKDEK
jgi:hypothetical protein